MKDVRNPNSSTVESITLNSELDEHQGKLQTKLSINSAEAFNQSQAESTPIDLKLSSRAQAPSSMRRPSWSRAYPYYPPRRPIQRSLFADKRKLNLTSTPSEPYDSTPAPNTFMPSFHAATDYQHTSKQTRTDLNTATTVSASQPRASSQTSQLSSPVKALFDYTVHNFYAGLVQLQSAWNSALYKERKEKEAMKSYYLKMQRDRDSALERTRDLEKHLALSSVGTKRSRKDDEENGSIQLPIPPTCTLSLTGTRNSDTSFPDDDSRSLVYPPESSRFFSPPPPPISGRHIFFSASPSSRPPSPAPSSFQVLSRECSSEHTLKSPPTPPTSALLTSLSRSSSPSSSNRGSRCSSSSKRRKLSDGSSEEEDSTASCSSPVLHAFREASGNDSDGECDMDMSDSDSSDNEEFFPNLSHLSGPGKKLLFDENTDEARLMRPSSSFSASAIAPVPDQQVSSKLKLPPLNLFDLNRMYFNYGGIIYCRACCSRKSDTRWRCMSPLPAMDARQPDLDVLMDHCTSQHPVAYSDVAGLTLDQVFRLQKLLKENVLLNTST